MNILLGNLKTFTRLGNAEKMQELEDRLKVKGYENEDNCEANRDTSRLTYHIYDIPRTVSFSVLDQETIKILKEYSNHFDGVVGVSAEKVI